VYRRRRSGSDAKGVRKELLTRTLCQKSKAKKRETGAAAPVFLMRFKLQFGELFQYRV